MSKRVLEFLQHTDDLSSTSRQSTSRRSDGPYKGRAEIHMFGLWATFGNVVTPLRNIVGNDRVVFTEWLDQSDFGGKHYAVPCVGVFEFEGDKIAAWRLYYDSAAEVSNELSGLNPPQRAKA